MQPQNSLPVQLFYHPASLEHDAGYGHPESPSRLSAVIASLLAHGYSQDDLQRPRPVEPELLAEVHDPRYIAAVKQASARGGGYWDADTHISPASYEAAILGAGAAEQAVDAAMSGARAAFALVRPPGHHALVNSAMGFCIFNNIAVAAHHATRKYGLSRVLIVDWDVHHGNGTQDLFYTRPDVLFFSTHQYPFYPGTGAIADLGEGKGEGYTANVPLPARTGDRGYLEVFNNVLVPLARRYRPEIILISAGYDAHIADPLAGMGVTTAGFSEMARIVRGMADELCEGRLAAVLEGGYNPEALAQSVVATLAMLTAPFESETLEAQENTSREEAQPSREPKVSHIVQVVKELHRL